MAAKISEERVQWLTNRFNRWTKTFDNRSYDRIYFDPRKLGLHCEYYKTGNVYSANIGPERISNSEARRILDSKAYYDVLTGELSVDSKMQSYFGNTIERLLYGDVSDWDFEE